MNEECFNGSVSLSRMVPNEKNDFTVVAPWRILHSVIFLYVVEDVMCVFSSWQEEMKWLLTSTEK